MPIHKIDISQGWTFRQISKSEWLPAEIPGCVHTDLLNNKLIDDPFYRTSEMKLQWIDKTDWEYRTQFKVSDEALKMKSHRLVFEGLDTYAEVYLNGRKILDANNMFRTWIIDINKGVLLELNELKVLFRSPISEDVPKYDALEYHLPAVNDLSEIGELGDKRISVFARKAPYHYGWDWAPRFVTSGIWRPVYLLSWNDALIESIHFDQTYVTIDKAKIEAIIEINSEREQILSVKITEKNDDVIFVDKSVQLRAGKQFISFPIEINNPNLWWCNGLGKPYLYLFKTEICDGNTAIDQKTIRVGVRQLKVVQEKDEKGRSFYIELNGKAVFMKGANYIPNDNFVIRVHDSHYEHIIQSAVDANMNMLRLWGGGIYENDIFYELCDHYGILVWHDFMFACSMYPGDAPFLENVKQEVYDNVKRLRNHACIALWCGNNENDMLWNRPGEKGWKDEYDSKTADKIWGDYHKLFYELIPTVLKELDSGRFYWPSSPLAEYDESSSYLSTSGDMHYWGVWHNKEPFVKYKDHPARFMSEFGFQSFPEFASIKKYTIPEDWDIESVVMSAHQRSGIGNKRIKIYMERDYHLPKSFEHMLYLSQVLQAEGMKIGFEAHRRSKPYCMGSLYWQINDCWPVASWSSIDYYGRWKALHYFVQKAFAPVLISPNLDKEKVEVYLVSDLPEPINCRVELELINFTGDVLWKTEMMSKLKADDNLKIFESLVSGLISTSSKNNIVLNCSCYENDMIISENQLYFEPVKHLDLIKPNITLEVNEVSAGYEILLSSDILVKNLQLSLDEHEALFSNNYFDLLPGKQIQVKFITNSKIKQFEEKLKIVSVYDTYQ